MLRKEVTCVNKDDRHNPYERITHVGGEGGLLTGRWKMTQEEAIEYIEGGNMLLVDDNGSCVRVIVAQSPHGNKHLKTEADGTEPNNLLSLPECL